MATTDSVDINDPCAVIELLRKARLRLIAGESEVRVRFGEDDVTFKASSRAEIDKEIAELEPLCAERQGRVYKPRRRAFSAGF